MRIDKIQVFDLTQLIQVPDGLCISNDIKMNTTNKTNCKEAYGSPAVNVIEVLTEGVLCESNISINDWENDDELLEFD